MPRWAHSCCLVLVASLMLQVPATAQAPYGFRHVATRERAAHLVYDSFHQRFYGTVPGEGAVYVISETNSSVIQKINVPSAYGLDLSVDGTRLYVSNNVTILGEASSQMIFVIDTTTLHIVDILRATVSLGGQNALSTDNVPSFLASLSNGQLAYAATSVGVTGGAIFLYDPSAGLSTPINPIGYYQGSLYKAASGNGFVSVSDDSAGEQVSVFDTASGTYTANVRFTTTNNGDVVMSPDGSMVLLGGHILCDRTLQQIADIAGPGQPTSLAWSSQGSSFSPDGAKIYVASILNATSTLPGGGTTSYANPVVYVFSSSTHQLLHTVPLPEGSPSSQTGYSGMAVGSSGKAMVIDNTGFLELDPSTAPVTLPGAYSQELNTTQPTSPDGGTAISPQPTTVNGAGFRSGATVYFGQTPVSTTYISTNVLDIQPPSGSPGFVDVSIAFPDGWALLASQAYSYGPVIAKQSETAGSSRGGTSVTVYGEGFDVASGGYPAVLVGGQGASVTAANSKSVTFNTPAGAVGPADIQLTSIFGTTTVPGGFTYVTQQLIPSLLANQMVVDNARNRIYVADANSGSVFVVNATTLATTVLFTPAAGGVRALAMTPDGSELLATNAYTCTIDVIDLTTGKDLRSIVPTPGNQPGTLYPNELVATANGTVLVGLIDSSLYDEGELVEVNLTTGATTLVQDHMFAGILLTASADGAYVYIAQSPVDPQSSSADRSSGSAAEMWSSASDGIVKESSVGEYGPYELSTTDIGDRVMDACYTSDQVDTWLRFATACAPDSQLVQGRDLVYGATIHSSGSLGYLPTTKGVEIFDIHHGQTILAIGDAAGTLGGYANLAISHDGSRIYLAQPDGIGVITLPVVPLSIGSLAPSRGSASGGQTVVLRGSGFVQGATVTVDGNPAGVQFVDSTQLILTMPAVTAAEDVVTVANPGGGSYSLDAAWNANAVSSSIPVLASISPVQSNTGGTLNLTVNGSGFEPDSVALLNGIAGKTQFVSANQLSATFYHLPGPGTQLVTVENPTNTTPSNSLSLNVFNPAPYLDSLNPSSIPAGSSSFVLTAFGNNSFSPSSVVLWNGTELPSQFLGTSYITTTVPASLVGSVGTASITVSTPQATPGVSNAQTFTVTASVAGMTVSSPSIYMGPVLAGGTASTTFAIASTGAIPLTITQLTSTDPRFSFSGCITTLSQSQSCTVTVVYTPVSNSGLTGETGSLTITSNAVSQPTIKLFGFSGNLVFYPDSTQLSVSPGRSATDSINVISYGYIPALTAQLTCSGLPANAACSFAPASFSMPFINAGNGHANFTVTITTKAPVSGLLRGLYGVPGGIAIATLLVLWRLPKHRRSRSSAFLYVAFLAGVAACGGSGSNSRGGGGGGGGSPTGGTPAGTYAVTITATIPGAAPVTQVVTLVVGN
jgi:hypothetical protein